MRSGALERWMFGDYLGGVWWEAMSCGGGNCGRIGVGFAAGSLVIRRCFRVVSGDEKAVGWWRMKAGCWVDLGEQFGEVLRPGRVLDY